MLNFQKYMSCHTHVGTTNGIQKHLKPGIEKCNAVILKKFRKWKTVETRTSISRTTFNAWAHMIHLQNMIPTTTTIFLKRI